jgi:uncharacterized protein with LGFP repeats
MLGSPTGSEYDIEDGSARHYQWGNLYWSDDTGVHEVHGAIKNRYISLGGPAGFLGFPETDEEHLYFKQDVPEQRLGARNDFEGGAISWTPGTGAKWMGKDVAEVVPYYSFPDMGYPVHDEQAARNGRLVTLSSGTRVYDTPTGVHVLSHGYPSGSNGILDKYEELGDHDGFLKLPRTGGPQLGDTGKMQAFQGGDIYQCGLLLGECGTDEAYYIKGAIRTRFYNAGGIGTLGYPVSDELTIPSGKVSHFEHGSIYWNSATGNTSIDWD